MQRRVQIIFIAAFLLMISLPFMLFALFENFADTINYENRTLTTAQDIADAPIGKKPIKIENLLNDYAPFKNEFLQLNAFINYGMFGCVQNNEVLLGKDQWLFYKNVSDSKSLDDYQGINQMTQAETQDFAQKISQLNEALKTKGTQLCLLIAPNKESVYSQYMPDAIPKIAQSKGDVLVEYLQKNTNVHVVYPKEQLINLSKTQQTYYKYDTHWNNAGALAALNQLSPAFANCTAVQANGEPLQDLSYLSALYKLLPRDAYFEIIGEANKTDKRLLMLHDSFGNALIPQLEKAYDCQFVHSSAFNTFDINYEADVIVIETVERFIHLLPQRIDSMLSSIKIK